MKTKLVNGMLLGCLMMVTGCLSSSPDAGGQKDTSARGALVSILDNQASALISGINEVIIKGDFINSFAMEHPPEPIPLKSNDDVNKAVNYLLANGTSDVSGKVWTYLPDARFCSEVVAQNDPSDCEKTLSHVVLVQTVMGESSGLVEIQFYGHTPFQLAYTPNGIGLSAELSEMLSAMKSNGATGLPSHASGVAHASIATPDAFSTAFEVGIDEKIEVSGTDGGGGAYAFSIPAVPSMAMVNLNTALLRGMVVLAIPAIEAKFPIRDKNGVTHSAQVHFPGLSGSAVLDDGKNLFSVAALKLAADVKVDVDGQPLVQATIADALNAELSSSGGYPLVNIVDAFEVQVDITGLANVLEANGTLDLKIAAGSQFNDMGNGQVKVLAGSLGIEGTGDFLGSLTASPNQCLEGSDPLVEVTACK